MFASWDGSKSPQAALPVDYGFMTSMIKPAVISPKNSFVEDKNGNMIMRFCQDSRK